MRRGIAISFIALGSGCSLLAPSDAEVTGGAGRGGGSAGTAGDGGRAAEAGTAAPGGQPANEGGTAGSLDPEAGQGGEGASETGGRAGASTGGVAGTQTGAGTGGGGVAGQSGTLPPTEGLVLWLDAERVTPDSGQTTVSNWADQSGRGNDATQPTTSARPRLTESGIGSRRSISFDGASDFLMLPAGFEDFSAGLSFFAVAQLASDANCPALLQLWNSHDDAILFLRFTGRFQYESAHDYASTSTASYSAGEPHSFGLVHGIDGQVRLFFDGTAAGSHADMDLPTVVMRNENRIAVTGDTDGGGTQCLPFEGLIGEMLLYDRALKDVERRSVEAYLAAKWSGGTP